MLSVHVSRHERGGASITRETKSNLVLSSSVPLLRRRHRDHRLLEQLVRHRRLPRPDSQESLEDAQEIDQLISYLINKKNFEGVVLLGHSTGCQAPVSDKEYKPTLPETPALIDLAAKMTSEGRVEELVPREAEPCALSLFIGGIFTKETAQNVEADVAKRLNRREVDTEIAYKALDELRQSLANNDILLKEKTMATIRLMEKLDGGEPIAICPEKDITDLDEAAVIVTIAALAPIALVIVHIDPVSLGSSMYKSVSNIFVISGKMHANSTTGMVVVLLECLYDF
ncbi:hypothetical protein Bca4012_057236 [Brassica carinata]